MFKKNIVFKVIVPLVILLTGAGIYFYVTGAKKVSVDNNVKIINGEAFIQDSESLNLIFGKWKKINGYTVYEFDNTVNCVLRSPEGQSPSLMKYVVTGFFGQAEDDRRYETSYTILKSLKSGKSYLFLLNCRYNDLSYETSITFRDKDTVVMEPIGDPSKKNEICKRI
jgi:hypothetical protein